MLLLIGMLHETFYYFYYALPCGLSQELKFANSLKCNIKVKQSISNAKK